MNNKNFHFWKNFRERYGRAVFFADGGPEKQRAAISEAEKKFLEEAEKGALAMEKAPHTPDEIRIQTLSQMLLVLNEAAEKIAGSKEEGDWSKPENAPYIQRLREAYLKAKEVVESNYEKYRQHVEAAKKLMEAKVRAARAQKKKKSPKNKT